MVRQVRVIRNTSLLGVLSLAVLWLARNDIVANAEALLWGGVGGAAYAGWYWRRLRRRIARSDRRYGRNKILVQFISVFEFAAAAAATNIYLLGALAVALILIIFLNVITDYWWAVLGGSFGFTGAGVLTVLTVIYERRHGPLYYQYDSRGWLGGEGMLYRTGVVEEALTPKGMVSLDGELWSAVSKSGENIGEGEKIEVVSRDGLVLHVDRIGGDSSASQ